MSLIEEALSAGDEQADACIKGYAFGDRFCAPGFCHATSNFLAGTFKGYFDSSDQLCLSTSYAFDNIPSDRVILQSFVDDYCLWWSDADHDCSLDVQERLPSAFRRRAMKRFQELNTMSAEEKGKKRCYMEHVSDVEKEDCQALHMRYDEKKDLAYFE